MNRTEWITIAEVLGAQRAALVWPPPGLAYTNADVWHELKLRHFAQLEAIDRIAMTLAAALDKQVRSFDVKRFLRIVDGKEAANRSVTDIHDAP
jgi:hypothetical protein